MPTSTQPGKSKAVSSLARSHGRARPKRSPLKAGALTQENLRALSDASVKHTIIKNRFREILSRGARVAKGRFYIHGVERCPHCGHLFALDGEDFHVYQTNRKD